VSMFGKVNYIEQGVTTLIGKGTNFKGSINTQGTVRIEGLMEGQINSQGDVYIAEHSKVKADVFAKRVIVAGELSGTVEALNGLEITRTGNLQGDVSGSRLIISEGAIYKGKVNMDIISSKSVYEEEQKNKAITA
jgi:cytoskeletal protein CcmA (bactofilin family)